METNLEQIIALEPQVLVMSIMAQTEDQIISWSRPASRSSSDAQNIEGVYTAIVDARRATGRDAEAEPTVANMRPRSTRLPRAGELQGKRVSILRYPLCNTVSGWQGYVYG
ncbi:MAG: hypothetical protein R2912_09215 [Eubacteriales bacterium]